MAYLRSNSDSAAHRDGDGGELQGDEDSDADSPSRLVRRASTAGGSSRRHSSNRSRRSGASPATTGSKRLGPSLRWPSSISLS